MTPTWISEGLKAKAVIDKTKGLTELFLYYLLYTMFPHKKSLAGVVYSLRIRKIIEAVPLPLSFPVRMSVFCLNM